ncbi:uncharacterized protein JCM15063_001050 [Sporobolomyces koalae]|uniref:uncharacterized protein n=1 Tax=Sporobolomyces koalae TaxID=500713 RepID=UPI003178BBF1
MSRTTRTLPTRLPRDIQAFLSSYPSQPSNPSATANLNFYQNRIAAQPSAKRVIELQDHLRENWQELEYNHSFIQWLFPIREQGVNYGAQPLEVHEIDKLKSDPIAMDRLLESYKIMLAFYGFKLVDPTTGELEIQTSSPNTQRHYSKRFENLERNPHNFLRITRILKCLNEFGFDQHPPLFLLYILALQSTHGYLSSSALMQSMDGYWKWCVRDDQDRQFVVDKIEAVRTGDSEFTVEDYQDWIRRRAQTRKQQS